MLKIIGIIPARYKSSRFPGKPLVQILGHSMIWWVYQQVKKVKEFDGIYVATDDERIKEECQKNGMNVLMTSSTHKTGTDRVAEAAEKTDADIYINIQGDEPVIEPEMIRQLIRIFDDPTVYFGTLKKEIKDSQEIQAYSTVKVVTDKKNDALYFSRNVIPSNVKDTACSRVFRHVGIYGYRKDFLLKFTSLECSELELGEAVEPLRAMENGYRIRVAETEFDSIGVDLPEHVKKVEEFIQRRDQYKNERTC